MIEIRIKIEQLPQSGLWKLDMNDHVTVHSDIDAVFMVAKQRVERVIRDGMEEQCKKDS